MWDWFKLNENEDEIEILFPQIFIRIKTMSPAPAIYTFAFSYIYTRVFVYINTHKGYKEEYNKWGEKWKWYGNGKFYTPDPWGPTKALIWVMKLIFGTFAWPQHSTIDLLYTYAILAIKISRQVLNKGPHLHIFRWYDGDTVE